MIFSYQYAPVNIICFCRDLFGTQKAYEYLVQVRNDLPVKNINVSHTFANACLLQFKYGNIFKAISN